MVKLKNPEPHPTIVRRYNVFNCYRSINKLLEISAKECGYINLEITPSPLLSPDHIDIITIAFNNTFVIKHQIKKVKKNILDKNYTHIIIDNSSDLSQRVEIKNICIEEQVAYLSLPAIRKSSAFLGSDSHAIALNWVYYNLIKKRKPCYFGFLDHDLYPLKSVSIQDKIQDQPFYGRKDIRDNCWYLWPGFAFFRLSSLDCVDVNFFPTKAGNVYLDTGGALWHTYYKNLNVSDYLFAERNRVYLNQIGYDFPDTVEFIDNLWFHSENASMWRSASDYRSAINDILDNEKIITSVSL